MHFRCVRPVRQAPCRHRSPSHPGHVRRGRVCRGCVRWSRVHAGPARCPAGPARAPHAPGPAASPARARSEDPRRVCLGRWCPRPYAWLAHPRPHLLLQRRKPPNHVRRRIPSAVRWTDLCRVRHCRPLRGAEPQQQSPPPRQPPRPAWPFPWSARPRASSAAASHSTRAIASTQSAATRCRLSAASNSASRASWAAARSCAAAARSRSASRCSRTAACRRRPAEVADLTGLGGEGVAAVGHGDGLRWVKVEPRWTKALIPFVGDKSHVLDLLETNHMFWGWIFYFISLVKTWQVGDIYKTAYLVLKECLQHILKILK
jgi:hypothetical protein